MSAPPEKRAAGAAKVGGRYVEERAAGASAPPLLNPDAGFLAAFLHPVPLQAFLREHLTRKCLVLRGTPARATAFMEANLRGGDVEALASETSSEAIHAWVRTAAGIETVKLDDAASAMVLHRAGASLYFRAPEDFEAAFVPAVSDALGLGRSGYYGPDQREPRGEVETFVSRAGHVTGAL